MFTYAITNRSDTKFQKMERSGLHVMFYYYSACCALRKDERKLQYSRSNILGFSNTGDFTSNNVPDGIKNATHNTFSNFRKSWLLKLKYPAFFGNGLTQARDYLMCTPI
jgi:hypothetical protein